MTITEPPCFSCKHLLAWPHCQAFPAGIPATVRDGDNDHSEPIPNDNGLQFEPASRTQEDVDRRRAELIAMRNYDDLVQQHGRDYAGRVLAAATQLDCDLVGSEYLSDLPHAAIVELHERLTLHSRSSSNGQQNGEARRPGV